MPPVAIILNGASSSGKTSIARALQGHFEEPLLHACGDSFAGMFDWPSLRDSPYEHECFDLCIETFHNMLGLLANSRFPIVVDHVFERPSWFNSCLFALQRRTTYVIGVHCPVDILAVREKERGDRTIGLAERQIGHVHAGKTYSLQVDTSLATPDECAAAIASFIQERRGV